MSDREEAEELLRIAARELAALGAMIDPGPFAIEIFGFVAQQCVEKCLKAWLCGIGQTYPLTHDLRKLLDLLATREQDVDSLPPLADLNPFAVEFRYARVPATLTFDRGDILRRATAVFEHVRQQVAAGATTSGCPEPGGHG